MALLGHVDHLSFDRLFGWALDSTDPQRRIHIDIFDGDQKIGSTVAEQFRQDLREAGIGDGYHGFSIALPSDLLPFGQHTISVRCRETGADLGNSPKILRRTGGSWDPRLEEWLARHVDAMIEGAVEPADVETLIAFAANILGRVLSAHERLAGNPESAGPEPVRKANVARERLPNRLKAVAERAVRRNRPLHVPTLATETIALTIIIAATQTLEDVCAALACLLASPLSVPVEIIVVDASGDVDLALLPVIVSGGLRYLRISRRAGYLESYASGLPLARGENLLFLDSRVRIGPQAIETLLSSIREHGPKAIVAPRVVSQQDRVLEAGTGVFELGAFALKGRNASTAEPHHRKLVRSDDVPAASFMMPAKFLDELGRFEGVAEFAAFAVTDICFRAREAGGVVLVQGAADAQMSESAWKEVRSSPGRGDFVKRWVGALQPRPTAGQRNSWPWERGRRALMVSDAVPCAGLDADTLIMLDHARALGRMGFDVTHAPARESEALENGVWLLAAGVEVDTRPPVPVARDVIMRNPQAFDVIYLHRTDLAASLIETCRNAQPRAKVILNFAELPSLALERRGQLLGDSELTDTARRARAEELALMSRVDAVVVHGRDEHSVLQTSAGVDGGRLHTILWSCSTADAPQPVSRKGVAFLGSYRRRDNIETISAFANSVFPGLRSAIPGIELVIAGSHLFSGLPLKDTRGIVLRGAVPDAQRFLAGVRLTVAPTRTAAGIQYKAITSLAAGVPCAMSSTAASGLRLPEELSALLVADNDEEMVAKMVRLYQSDDAWLQASSIGLSWVAEHFTAARLDTDIGRLLDFLGADDMRPNFVPVS